mgnify:CR=1 FL=1
MADGLRLMKQYGTFSNAAPVLLQRPSDDTRNLQLHRCISMSSAADPSSDLRANSIIPTLRDDLGSTIVIRAGSGAASPGIPFRIGYTTYPYQTDTCRRWNRQHNTVTRSASFAMTKNIYVSSTGRTTCIELTGRREAF